MPAGEARAVASAANTALTLALTNGTAMEEDGQGGEMAEEDAFGIKKLHQGVGLGPPAP